MKILILGGTVFVGRALVEAGLQRGHEITLFNRGKSNPALFPQVEQIHGDRDGGLDALAGRSWDCVIDTCGYVPRIVRASAEFLAQQVERYIFTSTISVYAESRDANRDEDAPLGTLEDSSTEEITGTTYGPLKVLCEQAAEAALPGRTLVIRPGLIVGPGDPTNRFTYWPRRVRQGGRILAPVRPGLPTQFIDVRDLAEWTLTMAEQRATGIYNATGPARRLTLGEVLGACARSTNAQAEIVWASQKFLLAHEVKPWMDLPLWIPDPDAEAFNTIRVQRAVDAGLRFRPLEETIRATLAWLDSLEGAPPGAVGISLEREAELLAKLDEWQPASSDSGTNTEERAE